MKNLFNYLLATVTLMILSSTVMAQDGKNPMAGSSHAYKIAPGDAANTLAWSISGGDASDYSFNTALDGDSVNITWNASAVGKTFTLIITETTPAPASCSTVKQLEINPVANSFDVILGALTDACNNNSGTVSPADSATSVITVPFDMETGGTTWNPQWEVTFDLTVNSGNARILSVALASGASGSLSDLGGGSYSVTTISSASGIGSTSVEVEVKGYSFEDVSVDIEITAAKELQYNTSALSTGSWSPSTNTIYKIPNTSDITTD